MSGIARRRIRSFSVWLWVAGTVVLSLSALNTYSELAIARDRLAFGNRLSPWTVEDPTVFEPDGTTYSGEGSGLIKIPLEVHDQDPYLATLVTGGYVSLNMTEAGDLGQNADDRAYPTNVGALVDPEELLLVTPDADLELWVDTEDPWEFTLAKTPVTEITGGFAGGVGNDILVYRGDAASARFEHTGPGMFYVTVTILGSPGDASIISHGEVDQRQSWPPTEAVYFSIESDDAQDTWSVDIDELATDAPPPYLRKGTP